MERKRRNTRKDDRFKKCSKRAKITGRGGDQSSRCVASGGWVWRCVCVDGRCLKITECKWKGASKEQGGNKISEKFLVGMIYKTGRE